LNSPRLLSPAIVVDANILISAVLGSATGAYLDRVAGERSLMTSEASMREASRVVGHIRPLDLPVLDALLDLVTIVPGEDVRAADLEDAERTLRTATASKNGSENDAHLLALAWTVDADLWSHDRDFAGTGWPSWSTANLMAALEGA
jgi:predicted nucleic acid-binding protein